MYTNELLFDLADDRRRALIAAAAADRRGRLFTRVSFRSALGARLIRLGLALVA